MARGWESKSVEEQIESAMDERKARAVQPALTAQQQTMAARRREIELSRARVATELDATPHERRRDQLRQALSFLDAQLQALGR